MDVVTPNWGAVARVRGFTTTRGGGVSRGPYASLNLGGHVDDDAQAVSRNREILRLTQDLPHPPRWLRQTHGRETVDAADLNDTTEVEADAAYTNRPNLICAIQSADCLPLLLCDKGGEEVAAVHAGWRGLHGGVVESTIARFSAPPTRLMAWIGPGISASAYAVGADFRDRFVRQDPVFLAAFRFARGRWYADLPAIAEQRLRDCGVAQISSYAGCTYSETERFFSYRRDGRTGRMATLIWIHAERPGGDEHEAVD